MKISKIELYSCLRSICKDFNGSISIKLKASDDLISTSATFDIRTNLILLNINQYDSLDNVLSVFFHELGHLVNKELGKFPLYHRYLLSDIPKNKRRYFLATALRAEQYTDKMGKKLMKIYFPDLKFTPAYPNKFYDKDLKDMRIEFQGYFNKLDLKKKN